MDEQTPPTQPLRRAFEYELTEAEALAALEVNQVRLGRRLQRSARISALGILAGMAWLGLVYLLFFFTIEHERSPLRVLAVVALLCGIGALSRFALQRLTFRIIAAGTGSLHGRRSVSIAEDGLRCRGPSEETSIGWSGIRSIEEQGGQVFIYVDDFSFIPISASAFVDAKERAALVAELRRRAGYPATAPPSPVLFREPAASAPPEEGPDRQRGAAARRPWDPLVEGIRLAFLRPPGIRSRRSRGNWSPVVLLVFFTIAIAFLRDLLDAGPKGTFSPSGLPGVLFEVPVMVVAAWALARLAVRPRSTLALLIALMSLTVPIDVVLTAAHLFVKARTRGWGQWSDQFARAPYGLAPLWFTVAASVCAVRLLEVPRRRWFPAALITGLLVAWPLTLARDRTLWWRSEPDPAGTAGYERLKALVTEDAFYRQPQLLQQQLASLKPGKKGVIDLYFIGVAAYAQQDVFMKEVHSVAKLFEERFGTEGRSLMLINNPATVGESPIASSTSLRLALKRVAEVMDRDEDILFLFITSHGSKEHGASFDFYPMRLKPLEPARLKELLDEAGIRRRVVVVSACYSGSFVDALKDDGTLAIAASAADRNSFGCSNDADFTYFGKAYFDEALRHTYSFSEAFDIAKTAIAERERKESLRSSDPRMFVGEGIGRALQRFATSRHSAAVTAFGR